MGLPLRLSPRDFTAGSLLVASLACLVLIPPAEATWPGKNGGIAFSRSGSEAVRSKSDIWIETRSGEQRRLTATPRADESAPAFSPNGRWIVYVRRLREDADVWLMRSDGSDKRPLVDGEQDELQPSFFPSGRSIVFTAFDGSRDWDVRSIRIDGEGLRPQVSNATYPIVSPNGRWLAYSAVEDGVGGIRLRNLRTRKIQRVTTGSAQGLDFSPNGRRIVFTGQRPCRRGGPLRFALLTVGVGDRRTSILRRGCNREFIAGAWSPNGRKIVFTHKRQQGRRLSFRLGMMTARGTPTGGAPRHRAGANEIFPRWQPLR